MGDTIPKKDQYVKNVASNEIAFLKNKFPVEVDVEAIKVGKGNATVSISNNGKHITSQSVNFPNGKYDYKHLTFVLDAKELGYQRYTVSVSKANGEYNYSNNTRDFYIEILDARSPFNVYCHFLSISANHFSFLYKKSDSTMEITNQGNSHNIEISETKRISSHEFSKKSVIFHHKIIQIKQVLWQF